MNHRIHAHSSSGFTLMEILVTLALGTILITVAVPAMAQMIASNRVTSAINNFTAHLQLARSEALKTGQRTVLCPSADGTGCLGSRDWHRGYMIFVDTDADRSRDPGEAVVKVHQIDSDAFLVNAGERKTVTYQPSGGSAGSNLTVTFCDANGRTNPKAVVVSMSGRPRIATIHPNGTQLSCG